MQVLGDTLASLRLLLESCETYRHMHCFCKLFMLFWSIIKRVLKSSDLHSREGMFVTVGVISCQHADSFMLSVAFASHAFLYSRYCNIPFVRTSAWSSDTQPVEEGPKCQH